MRSIPVKPGTPRAGGSSSGSARRLLSLIQPALLLPDHAYCRRFRSGRCSGDKEVGMAGPHEIGVGTGPVPLIQPLRAPTIMGDQDYPILRELYQNFAHKLDEHGRKRLRVPLSRLNRAIRSSSPLDAAIELGITLETIFLNDATGEKGELSHRLRVRASRFLGASNSERDEIFELFGELYWLRSSIVHNCEFSKKQIQRCPEWLILGYDRAAEAIARIINDGWPNWKVVTLH